jgi:hypothetical protein
LSFSHSALSLAFLGGFDFGLLLPLDLKSKINDQKSTILISSAARPSTQRKSGFGGSAAARLRDFDLCGFTKLRCRADNNRFEQESESKAW